jgi:endonuclease/exonuclease/phosphatase family metal-dependent hydrolase
MNKIMEAPLQDVVRNKFDLHHPQPSYKSLLDLGSYPTTVLGHVNTPEKQQGFLERIDFILASPNLAKRCQSAGIVRDDKPLESISDHYPVMAVFKVNGPH